MPQSYAVGYSNQSGKKTIISKERDQSSTTGDLSKTRRTDSLSPISAGYDQNSLGEVNITSMNTTACHAFDQVRFNSPTGLANQSPSKRGEGSATVQTTRTPAFSESPAR